MSCEEGTCVRRYYRYDKETDAAGVVTYHDRLTGFERSDRPGVTGAPEDLTKGERSNVEAEIKAALAARERDGKVIESCAQTCRCPAPPPPLDSDAGWSGPDRQPYETGWASMSVALDSPIITWTVRFTIIERTNDVTLRCKPNPDKISLSEGSDLLASRMELLAEDLDPAGRLPSEAQLG